MRAAHRIVVVYVVCRHNVQLKRRKRVAPFHGHQGVCPHAVAPADGWGLHFGTAVASRTVGDYGLPLWAAPGVTRIRAHGVPQEVPVGGMHCQHDGRQGVAADAAMQAVGVDDGERSAVVCQCCVGCEEAVAEVVAAVVAQGVACGVAVCVFRVVVNCEPEVEDAVAS